MIAGYLSHGQASSPLSEGGYNVNKNNFNTILSEYSQKGNIIVKNTLADDGRENNISLKSRTSRNKAWTSTRHGVPGCRNLGCKVRGNQR
jgi:type VI secretion system protein ImpB